MTYCGCHLYIPSQVSQSGGLLGAPTSYTLPEDRGLKIGARQEAAYLYDINGVPIFFIAPSPSGRDAIDRIPLFTTSGMVLAEFTA